MGDRGSPDRFVGNEGGGFAISLYNHSPGHRCFGVRVRGPEIAPLAACERPE
jgi:hypothetical protein